MAGARRLPLRVWRGYARRVLLLLCLWLPVPVAADAPYLAAARYVGPTDRYPHGVLGDDLEYDTLVLTTGEGREIRITLPQELVFEDTAPRLLSTRGTRVAVVESHRRLGARLAIYGPEGRVAATPFIGTRFRWLAPVGIADLDGEGKLDIAYVDRPHLAKILRIWRFEDDSLKEVASLPGVTNHRIGEKDIAGGIRHCDGPPEMILSTADWSALLAVRFDGADFSVRQIGQDTRRAAFARAMACEGD